MPTLQLLEILDIRAASPLVASLVATRGEQVTIDAANVQRVGAQCVQVLYSARATWQADGVAFAIVNPSEAFVEGLTALGVPITKLIERDLTG